MLLNSWKNQFQYNIFSTASCTASGATCLFNAHGRTMGFWFLSKLLECVDHNTLPEFSVNAEKSVVSSVLLSTMRTIQDAQSTLLPTMLYAHNCTGIKSTLWRDRLKHKGKKGCRGWGKNVERCAEFPKSQWGHPRSTLTVGLHSTPGPHAKQWERKKEKKTKTKNKLMKKLGKSSSP